MRVYLSFLCLFLLSSCQSTENLSQINPPKASIENRYFEVVLHDQRRVVVEEGVNEPRSIGSYSIRLYGANQDFPYDDFINGLIRMRDGQVEDVRLSNNSNNEVVVLIKSAGSGGYISVDHFVIERNQLLLKN